MLPVVVVKLAPLASDISVRGGGRTRCTGEHLWIHDVGGDVTPVRTGRDGEPDVVGMPDARRGDVELPMRKARRVEADADANQRLSLRLVDGEGEGEPDRKLSRRVGER